MQLMCIFAACVHPVYRITDSIEEFCNLTRFVGLADSILTM